VPTIVHLAADEEVLSRPFAARANTTGDATVMRAMLIRLRALARGWLDNEPAGAGVLVREPDADGYRHWIRVPDRKALLAARRLTAVGFFGQARSNVDHVPIHELETGIVDTLERIDGILSYYDLALPAGGYGNLILCAEPGAPARVHGHELHRRAVDLTPRHYRSVRLHTGVIPSALIGDADLVVERTRYYDYGSEPAWLAVRELDSRTVAR
jgi:hypothetical protein